jgi:hypothetical protein
MPWTIARYCPNEPDGLGLIFHGEAGRRHESLPVQTLTEHGLNLECRQGYLSKTKDLWGVLSEAVIHLPPQKDLSAHRETDHSV